MSFDQRKNNNVDIISIVVQLSPPIHSYVWRNIYAEHLKSKGTQLYLWTFSSPGKFPCSVFCTCVSKLVLGAWLWITKMSGTFKLPFTQWALQQAKKNNIFCSNQIKHGDLIMDPTSPILCCGRVIVSLWYLRTYLLFKAYYQQRIHIIMKVKHEQWSKSR